VVNCSVKASTTQHVGYQEALTSLENPTQAFLVGLSFEAVK
jgi:hypothetical protein